MANPTTNYGWVLPIDQGSTGAWGALLDTMAQAMDTALFTVSGVASAALAKAGGVMTGRVDLLTETVARSDLGNITAAQALNLALAEYFTMTVTGAVTLSITNPPAGALVSGVVLRITNGAAFVITWPAGTKWPGGVVPVLTAAGVDLVVLISDDNGATWRGAVIGKDIK